MPVRNEATHVGEALRSVLEQDAPQHLPGAALEIIVLDGQSTDGTRAIVERIAASSGSAGCIHAGWRHEVRVVDNPGRTAAAALAVGLCLARGLVIVRVDGRASLPPDYVCRAIEALVQTGAACAGGALDTVGAGATGASVAAAMSHPFGAGSARFRTGGTSESGAEDPELWDVDTLAFGAYRADALHTVGGIDCELERNQDDELNHRLRAAGHRIVLVPDLLVRYVCRSTLAGLRRQYHGYGLWKARVLRTRGALTSFRALAPPGLVVALVVSVSLSWFLGSPWPLVVPCVYAGAALVAGGLAARRRPAARLGTTAAAFMTMHLAYGVGFLRGLVARTA